MSWIKKAGFGLLVLFVLFLVVIAALPLWMPWLVEPVLGRLGVDHSSYERVGYGRFALTEVSYARENVQVDAERVEGFVPTGWLWNVWRGGDAVDYLSVKGWRLEIAEAETDDEVEKPKKDISVFDIFTDIEAVLPEVVRWVPRATLGKGEIEAVGRLIKVEGAEWQQGQLTTEVMDERLGQTVELAGDLGRGLPFSLRGSVEPFPFTIDVTVSKVDELLSVRSEAWLAGNLLEADARFPRVGYLPETARFRSDNFRVPSEYLELEGYDDVRGSFTVMWQEGHFEADLQGRANPTRDWAERLPPLRVAASVRGDLESVLVEKLEVRSPWLVAQLSDPVAMDYGGELLTETSFFQIAADLKEQPFVDLEGLVNGEIRISPGEAKFPSIDFGLEAADLAGFELELARVEFNGSLDWPQLAVAALLIEGHDNSSVRASAVLDLDSMEFASANLEGAVYPDVVAAWVPENIRFGKASFTGAFEGPMENLSHRGEVDFEDLVAPKTHPMSGGIDWQGTMANLSEFALDLRAGAGRLRMAGATEVEEKRIELLLSELELDRDGEPLLASHGPSRLLFDWQGEPVRISLDELDWGHNGRGFRASAEVAWPDRGRFSANLRDLDAGLVSDFVDVESGFVSLASGIVEGSWDQGPLEFEALAQVRMDIDQDEILFGVDVQGESENLRVRQLQATSQGEALVFAEGTLPVSIWPGGEEILHIREDGEINFEAKTDPQAGFWKQIGAMTGVQLQDPRLSLEISGTPEAPAGHLIGSSPSINLSAFADEERPMPRLENLTLNATFDVEQVQVGELSLHVEGQRVEAKATLPMGTREWQAIFRERRVPDWEQISGRLKVPEAEVEAFTRFAPTVLSPQGTFSADIEILPGGLLDGLVTLQDAATRPIMPLGAIRDGTARVVLRERTAYLEEISATIGGEPVRVSGEVDIPFEQPLAFEVAVKARNLPLARRPGVVIRGDLDLAAKSENGATPTVSGRVDLHDSFYLAHLRVMPAGGVATPERRPPFFSVEQEPFADWKLDIELRGPSFLKIRGPIFQGELSANFNLSGTLEEPRAIGAATIDSGRVRFPFATMSIDQGEIALRREDPFSPQLFIVASGKTFGYDLTMDVTGTAEKPIIEFIANPPLSSEQALLMVTTGELPRDEIRFTTQQRASKFAIYFGQNLLYQLTGDDTAGDRLTIRSGEQVSEGGRETMSIELRLTEDWSVTGEYDRFDEYNMGLKWNIYSR